MPSLFYIEYFFLFLLPPIFICSLSTFIPSYILINTCYLSFYFLFYTLFFFSVITSRLVLYSSFFVSFLLRYYPSIIFISFHVFLILNRIFLPLPHSFHIYLFSLYIHSFLNPYKYTLFILLFLVLYTVFLLRYYFSLGIIFILLCKFSP